MPNLQSLSTYKLTAEQAADTGLDLLTGFHLVDGKERLIVLEGHVDGKAMKAVRFGASGRCRGSRSSVVSVKEACRSRQREGQGAVGYGWQDNEGGALGRGGHGQRWVGAKAKAACRTRQRGGQETVLCGWQGDGGGAFGSRGGLPFKASGTSSHRTTGRAREPRPQGV